MASSADPSGGAAAAADASRGSAIKLGAELAGRLIALATALLVARGLGVADFGLFAVLSGVAVVVAELSDLGIQGIAVPALVSGTIPLRALVRAKLRLTTGLLVAAALVAFVPQALSVVEALVPAAWQPSWQALVRRVPLLFPLIVYSVMAGWAELLGVALRVRGRRALEAATIVTLRASGLALAAAALWSGTGLAGLVSAMALSTLPPVALAAAFLARDSATAPAHDRGARPAEPGVGRTLKTSFPLAINGGLAILSLRIELLALALLRGSREAGLFAAALKVVELVNVVPAAIAAGAMPALAREAARGSGPVRRRTAATAALLAAPAAAGVILVAPGVVRVLGEGYAAAATPLRVLAPALLALFMNTVLLHALVAAGRARRLPVLTAARVAAAALLAVVLIPRLGATGAAAGFLLSELLLLVLAARACRAAGFDVPVARSLSAALAVTVPMAAAVAIVGAGPVGSIAVGVVTYVSTLAVARRWAPRLASEAGALGGTGRPVTGDEAPGPNPVALLFRHVLRRRSRALFAPRSRVLHLARGADAGALEGADLELQVVDVASARGRIESRRHLDGAYAGPGVFDPPDLATWGPALAGALRSGAPVLLCLGRRSPAEGLGLREARARLGPDFVWRGAFALGLLVPAESRQGWVRGHPQAFGVLAAVEDLVRRWPLLRARGDYVALEGARR